MSKIIVYILDKFVWMLLVTVITTQALQIAGVVEGPRTLGEIIYPEEHEYEFKLTAGDSREKRQAQERSQLLDNIFNIPIATLNSVNELLQSTRRLRLSNLAYQNQQAQVRAPRKTAKDQQGHNYFQGPRIQPDGSSSRVLLNV